MSTRYLYFVKDAENLCQNHAVLRSNDNDQCYPVPEFSETEWVNTTEKIVNNSMQELQIVSKKIYIGFSTPYSHKTFSCSCQTHLSFKTDDKYSVPF